MKSHSNALYLVQVGLAMFSMFFGAGNVVFPLLVGQAVHDSVLWAFFGLLITAVGVPFCGLFGVTLYDGNLTNFFARIGKQVGFVLIIILLGLVGPFGALPRCIALSYSTAKQMIPTMPIELFSLLAVGLIYFLTVKKSKIIDIIGKWLSPVLLVAIFSIVYQGLTQEPEVLSHMVVPPREAFILGLESGYQTMDLLGALFFCSFVINSLKKISIVDGHLDKQVLMKNTAIASLIGVFSLGVVYFGMSVVASRFSEVLEGIPAELILGVIAHKLLGASAGLMTSLVVILACLTTAIALAAVFSEFLHAQVSRGRISYRVCLITTCTISYFVANLEFSGIFLFLAPIVAFLYPALLVLTLCNIAYKVWGFNSVKIPVATSIVVMIASYFS